MYNKEKTPEQAGEELNLDTPDFTRFFRMAPEDVKRYAVEVVGFFDADDTLEAAEIGDGNINYVTRVRSARDGRSLIVKQADRFLRSSGRPLDAGRSRLEARMLQLQRELTPRQVPQVYRWDETMAAISMEDIGDYRALRGALSEGKSFPCLAEELAEFLANSLLPTTDLVLDRAEKKRRAAFFTNVELCDITEDLVLTEPYDDYKGRNVIAPENRTFVEEHLYRCAPLRREAALLRDGFMNHAQALLHGDLHTGSIFVNGTGIKVIDPEFAFYGPMGYDIGNVLGNLFFPLAARTLEGPEDRDMDDALPALIETVYDRTRQRLEEVYDEKVTLSLYREPDFRRSYLDGVMADAAGYAGTEIIRRAVGDTKVPEITGVKDPAARAELERTLVRLGAALILDRRTIRSGAELTQRFRTSLT